MHTKHILWPNTISHKSSNSILAPGFLLKLPNKKKFIYRKIMLSSDLINMKRSNKLLRGKAKVFFPSTAV